MKGALGFLANFRSDGSGNNERHHAIRMEMRRRTRSWRVYDFHQCELTLRLARQALLDHLAPSGFFQDGTSWRFVLTGKRLWRKYSNSRRKGSTIEAPPAHKRSRHQTVILHVDLLMAKL